MVQRRFGAMKFTGATIGFVAVFALGCASSPGTLGSQAPSLIVAGAHDAQFELQIAASRDRYSVGEPINVSTRLTYLGPLPEIAVSGASSPVVVSLEQLDGPFDPGGGTDLACNHFTLKAGVPVDAPYQKSGGWSGDDPMADKYKAFFADPAVHVPPGTYRFTASADVVEGPCGGVAHNLKASIAITVVP